MLIVSDRQVAGEQEHLFPIFVNERRRRVDAGCEAQQSGPTAALFDLVERSRQDLLLNTRRIPSGSFPSLRHVEGMEFVVGLIDSHCNSPRRARDRSDRWKSGRSLRQPRRWAEQRRYCFPIRCGRTTRAKIMISERKLPCEWQRSFRPVDVLECRRSVERSSADAV